MLNHVILCQQIVRNFQSIQIQVYRILKTVDVLLLLINYIDT